MTFFLRVLISVCKSLRSFFFGYCWKIKAQFKKWARGMRWNKANLLWERKPRKIKVRGHIMRGLQPIRTQFSCYTRVLWGFKVMWPEARELSMRTLPVLEGVPSSWSGISEPRSMCFFTGFHLNEFWCVLGTSQDQEHFFCIVHFYLGDEASSNLHTASPLTTTTCSCFCTRAVPGGLLTSGGSIFILSI